jgi:hypothetical protein
MAFPGTYNISYYKGDTFEFRVYPKNSTGGVFSLTDYGNAKFTISTSRGASGVADQVSAYVAISDDSTYLNCTIRPADGAQLTAGTSYVYDVEVTKPAGASGYPYTYTLLNGNISVTDQVSGA